MDVKVTDNSKEFLEEFQKQISLALKAIGLTAEGYAKEDCPVDTGRLQNSIANEVSEEEKAVYIGTNVEYAVYVETDDTKDHSKESGHSGKAHFLRDACATHTDEYEKLVQDALKG